MTKPNEHTEICDDCGQEVDMCDMRDHEDRFICRGCLEAIKEEARYEERLATENDWQEPRMWMDREGVEHKW